MFGLGIWELLVILGIVVILFGAKRLPMIGEGLGGMITSFKKATKKEIHYKYFSRGENYCFMFPGFSLG